jgi:hypothetical protein
MGTEPEATYKPVVPSGGIKIERVLARLAGNLNACVTYFCRILSGRDRLFNAVLLQPVLKRSEADAELLGGARAITGVFG